MNKLALILPLLVMGFLAVPAEAQADDHEGASWVIPSGKAGAAFGASIGVGLIVIGAGKGISNIGGNAVQSIARQPEAADKIQPAMLLTAAFIEGVALFAVVVALLSFILTN